MTAREKWTEYEGNDIATHSWWWHMWYEYKQKAPKTAIQECEMNMLGEGVEVGEVESWEQAVEAEKKGRKRDDKWPPGEPWHVNVDGVEW